MTAAPTRGDRAAPVNSSRGARSRQVALGATGVLGELMITLGVLLLAFIVWQLWWTDVQGDRAQAQIVADLHWTPSPMPVPDGAPSPTPSSATPRHDAPPVMAEPGHAVTFATLFVPRWGKDYVRPVSQGVDRVGVLDPKGIGHYVGTAMPGGMGNFAISGHRTTYGKPFNRIAELVVGDPLVVRTKDNWFVYRVTSTEIVRPGDVQVIDPVPGKPGGVPTKRSITLTTCHPMFSARQRFIVHGVLDYWAPAADAAPAEISGGA
ncbi:class E sortase [Pengzhenrongella sp.]|uniref:class E sortase n=1 Tax=Pengzhenrongella sp. TaxID=2888820 RepID=UPI002F940FBF